MQLDAKIQDWNNARRRRTAWSVSGRKAVFTNGCFDLIHPGHLQYLQEAKALGDYLIIGLNSDASVRQLKGESRPIIDEQSRAKLLASFFFVDMIVLFEEQTPLKLIQNLRPDILAKGGDYAIDQIVGAKEVLEWNGKVEVLSFLEGHSSSKIITKIRKLKN